MWGALKRLFYYTGGRPPRQLKENPPEPPLVLTVGHSHHDLEPFLRLLSEHGVGMLIDVRSHPASSYAPHFGRRGLQASLAAAALEYVFMGRELGGRPSALAFYTADGRVDYAEVARSEPFRRGIDRLEGLAERSRVPLLCAEEDPLYCHRRRLVGRVLVQRGVGLGHIRGDGTVEAEAAVAAREGSGRGRAKQLRLFDERDGPWTSTRSVSRKGRRPTSSER